MRDKVVLLVRAGLTQERVGAVLKVSIDTLRKHYGHELDTAKDDAVGQVANSLYQKAIAGDPTSMIFYLKTQGRWSEPQKIVLGGDPENPVKVERVMDLKSLDPEARLAIKIAMAHAIQSNKAKG